MVPLVREASARDNKNNEICSSSLTVFVTSPLPSHCGTCRARSPSSLLPGIGGKSQFSSKQKGWPCFWCDTSMTVGPGRQAAVTEGLGGHRRDLDGLRGLALLVVVALHLDLLGGGFVGVDVFFVLSGFLVTSSMLRSPLSYSSFVARRVRRLVPASSAVAVLCVLASHVLSLPGVLRATRTAAVFCAAQSGNLFFAFLVPEGYFAASPNPLLHYWSLGVEVRGKVWQ